MDTKQQQLVPCFPSNSLWFIQCWGAVHLVPFSFASFHGLQWSDTVLLLLLLLLPHLNWGIAPVSLPPPFCVNWFQVFLSHSLTHLFYVDFLSFFLSFFQIAMTESGRFIFNPSNTTMLSSGRQTGAGDSLLTWTMTSWTPGLSSTSDWWPATTEEKKKEKVSKSLKKSLFLLFFF